MSNNRIRGRARGGVAISCLGLDTPRITFSTSDFPSFVNWPVRVTKTVPQAPEKNTGIKSIPEGDSSLGSAYWFLCSKLSMRT